MGQTITDKLELNESPMELNERNGKHLQGFHFIGKFDSDHHTSATVF